MSYRFTGIAGYGTRRSVIDNDAYYLYDTFDDTPLAAGAVNGTLAEPVGGARTVTDTNSKITISGGVLRVATGTAANNGVWWPIRTRTLGLVLLGDTTVATAEMALGWDGNTSGVIGDSISPSATNLYIFTSGVFKLVGASAVNTPYKLALAMRSAGMFYFIKGGAFTNWTLIYTTLAGATNMYPSVNNTGGTTEVFTADNIRVPKQLYIPVPLQSDGMSAATTDGLGNPENNGTAGNAYDGVGTPAVAAGSRGFSALSGGGLGVSVLACSSSDVVIEVNVTRTTGSAGIIARRADASNYIQCLHNGTNVIVSQVVAGSSTTLSTTAVAYSAGATMKFHVEGTAYRAFYNNTAAGSGTVPASTNTNHGIITNDLSGSFDNLVIWARSGYEGLSQL